MRGLPVLVTLLALLVSTRGGPISSVWDDDGSQCAKKCIAPQKFQYARDMTYEFDYLAETSTSMEDASEDSGRLSIGATVLVHVVSDCDMVLQLRDVTVKESDPDSQSMRSAPDSARAAALLESQPLRFSFQDGVVDELCPSDNEELWALNVKRGVLSAFQNSMSRLDSDQTVTEVDVAGTCPSEYHVQEKGWYSTTVKRSKDLLACTDRHDFQSAVQASPYTVQSSVQSMPLMKSTHECQQVVDQYGILSSTTCTENHQFRPFSRDTSGARTHVMQSLKYKTQSRVPVSVQPVSQRVSLVYQHGNQEDVNSKAQKEAEDILGQLCRETQVDIRPDTPRLFSSLVAAMRRVSSSGLHALYAKLEQNTLCANNVRTKKFFVDALPMAGTEATVTMMTQMLTSGDVTGLEADMWLTSLALIQEPTPGMLEQVKVLVTSQSLQEKAVLPVSTMINNLCQARPQCGLHSSVQTIMTAFEDMIDSSCYVNKKNVQQVLLALRAIGNAGHVSSAVSVVNKCVKRNKNPVEVRVTAAQAFRRMPCDADRSAVTFTMEDNQEDSELRVAAYLAVMTCPDDDTLQRVQLLLESETDQQVGSFVWSHLTNLQETSSPHKQAVRQLLKKVKLPTKFDLGRLQFSRNYEGSAFLKRINSGAGAESNLVWSSSSSLPRSISANLTVDLFGHSLNLLDFGLRLEGLEYLLETMLGPYGYFGQSDNKARQQLDELKGSLYMRMFGNEMSFQRFQGVDSFSSATSFNMLDFLIKLSKDHDVSMTHSMEFLDTEMTVPTSCGLPLSLTVKGTATMDLRASGKVDLLKVSASPRSLQIDGEIRPSGAVRVSGHMSVDAMVSRAALHVTGTLHSSSAVKARVHLDRGRVLSVELDVPEEKMELLDISSEFSIVHNTVEKKQKMITDNRQTIKMCTGDMASGITGLELCGELQYPNASSRASGPYFPFTGPTSLGVTLYKRDSHTSYKLLAKRVENKKKTMAQLSFNTPGSKVNRALAFDLVLNHEDKQLEISAASPWKKAEFKGGISATKKLMGVSGSFVTDDVNTYSVTSEVKIDEKKNGVTYTPMLEIRRPDTDSLALTGMVAMEMKSATADLSLTGLTAQPLTLKSAWTNTKKEVSLVGSVAKGDKQEYSVRVGTQMNIATNKIQVNPFLSVKTPKRELVSLSGSAAYIQDKLIKTDFAFSLLNYKPVSAQLSATKTERKSGIGYTGNANIKSAFITTKSDAILNVKKGRLINGRASLSYNMALTKGDTLRDRMVLMAKLSDRSTNAYNKYTVRSSLDSKSFPALNTAVKLSVDHKKKLSSGELEVKYGPNPKDKTKRVQVSATLARKIKNLKNVDLNYKMSAEAPEFNVDIRLRGKHSHDPNSVDSNVALVYGKGKQLSADLTLKDKSSKLTKMTGGLTLTAPGTGLTLKSDLTQSSKKLWEHNVHVKTDASQHSLSTTYKTLPGRTQEMTTTLDLDGLEPVTVTGQTSLDWDNLLLAASLQQGKTVYGMKGTQKLAKSRNGKWSVEVSVPSRRVTVSANAGKSKGKYEGSLEAAWDADNDKNAKVVVDVSASTKSSKDSSSHKASVEVQTPVQGYSDLGASLVVDSTRKQHQVSSKLVLGHKKQAIKTTLVVPATFNPRDLDLSLKVDTPFRGYGDMGLTLNHKLDTGLNTKLIVSMQKDQCEISLTAKNRGSDVSRDLQAQLDIKSSTRKAGKQSLIISGAHKDNGRQFANNVEVKVNNKVYSYVINMDVDTGSNSGDLAVSWPKDQMKTTWSHRLSTSDLSSTMTTVWSSNQRAQIDVTAAYRPGSVSGSLALQSPWSQARDWRADVDTKYGPGSLLSSSSLKSENGETFKHSLVFTVDATKTDMDFSMTSPWTQPIISKINAKYDSFPVTGNAEFSWEPRKKVTAEGSVIANNWDDLDINLKVTTPVRSMRTLAAEASSKMKDGEVVSQVMVDVGMRKKIVLATRVNSDLSGARVKLTTPWDQLRVVDTGMEMDVLAQSGKVKVDFKAVPVVGQYQASATWTAEEEMNARLRLDTPRTDFPYLQMVASSQAKRHVRHSRVELEYSPSQTYSLDSTYSLDVPMVLDMSLATPLEGYESVSASFRHNMRDTAMDTSAQVTYSNDQSVKASAMLDWSRGLDSSLTVTTPYGGWEQSSATLRHEGQWNDFNSRADVTVAGQSVTSSVKFLHKMKTDVQLTVTTPFAGWEKVEAAVSRKGDFNNMRAAASLAYSDQKMEASLLNKWNSRKARLVASVSTPYTENIKVNFEQTADLQTDASFSYGRQYSVDTSSSALFNSREVSASTTIKYRLGGPRHLVTASMAKVGSLQDLTLTASTSYDKQEVSLTAELNVLSDIKAALALKTPFSQFESLSASFHNAGDLSAMTTEADVEYMTDKHIHGKMELGVHGLEQLTFRGSLTSPFSGLEQSTMSASHIMGPKMCTGSFNLDTTIGRFGALDASYQKTGHVNNLKGEARVTYNSESLLDANLNHKLTSSRMQSSLRVQSPVLPEINVQVKHRGDLSQFSSEASASLGGNKVSSDTQWSMSADNVDLSQTLSSDIQGETNQAAIVLSRMGPLSDITVQLSGNVNTDKARIVGKLATVGDLSATLELESPFTGYRQLGASFCKTGEASDLTVTLAANLERQKMEVISKFANDDEVKGSVDISTPFDAYSQMGASFSVGEENAMLSANILNDRILVTGRFVNSNIMDGSLDIQTPFSGFNQLGAAFNYDGENAKVSAQLQDEKVEAAGRYVMADAIEGSLDLMTPFRGYNQMGAAFNYADQNAKVSGYLQNKKIEATGKLVNDDNTEGSIEVITPFRGYRQMGAAFNYDNQNAMISSYLEDKKIQATGKLALEDVMEGSIEVTTPFKSYKQIGAAFNYDNQNAMIAGNLEDQRIQATGKLVLDDVMEGKVEATTPFNGYRQIGAAFNYDNQNAMITGNIEDKKIEATGKLVLNDVMEGKIEVTTPFNSYRQMAVTANYAGQTAMITGNLEDQRIEVTGNLVLDDDMEGKIEITTPFKGYKQMAVVANYAGQTAMISGSLEKNQIKATGKLTYDDVVEGTVQVTTPFNGYRQMAIVLNYDGQKAMMSGNVENQKIEVSGRFVNDAVMEGAVDLKTPFNGYRQMGASVLSGSNSVTATANLQTDKVEMVVNYDITDDITGSVAISTPFTGFTQLGGQFQSIGDMSDLTITTSGNVENRKMELTAKLANGQDLAGSVVLVTPFKGYRNMGSSFAVTGDLSDLTFTADAFLHKDKVETKVTFHNGQDLSGSVSITTPFTDYHQMGASFQRRGTWPELSLQLTANLLEDKLDVRAAWTNKEALSASVNIATPFQDFQQLGASFKHTGNVDKFSTEAHVTYMDDQTVAGKVNFYNYRLRRIEASAELTTPFNNWEQTRVSYKHSGNSNKFACSAKMECGRGEHTADLKVNLRSGQDVQLIVKTPFSGFRHTQLTHSLSPSDTSTQWTGTLVYGEGQRASSQLTVSYPRDQFSSSFDLQTPFTSDLTATFDFQGEMSAFTRKMAIQYGDLLQFADETEFRLNDSPLLLVHETQTITYNGVSQSHALYLRREGAWNDVTLAAKGELNGEAASMDASFKIDFSRIEGNVKVNTPFDGYSDVGASFQHIGQGSTAFNTEASVQYADDQQVSAKLGLIRADWRRLQVTAQLTTPFEDWSQTQAEYRHTADNDGITCYAMTEYLGDQRVTGDLRVTSSPYPEMTLTMKTPWYNWEQVSATGSYVSDDWGKKEVSSKLDLGRGFVYTLNSGLSGSEDAANTVSARLTTPHADWQAVEARVSHEGGLKDFKSSAYLSTPLLDAVSASASLRFNSVFDVNAAASLDTPFEGLKDWKMEMVNGERGSQKTSHVILGWSSDQEVVMDGTWRHDNSWNERHLHADVSVTTPFPALRKSNWVLEHHATPGNYKQTVTGSLNDNKQVDLDLSTLTDDLPQVTLTLNEPYTMLYSVSRTREGAELSLDWDRNDPNSNLRVTSQFTDSSDSTSLNHDLHLKVTHPSRTVGAKYTLQSSSLSTSSQGEVYWGRRSQHRVFYNLHLADVSRRSSNSYEGKVKVGVLSRALQLAGSVSTTPVSRHMDATVHWDADRDNTKQLALKTSWTSGDKNKADVTVSLPSINQEVHVHSEVAVNQGKTLLDATTALSYSQDASKVLTLSSKLQDTTGSWDTGSNYTLQLTLTHPHTDLDVAMTSHLGASDDRYSAGVDTWYLTSGRQRKNLALRGEIDQLRQQITMEMDSPVKKVAIKGEVKSTEPYSLALTNRYDDDVTLHTDVTVDSNKRSFSFKTNYDMEHPEHTLVLNALYVNNTAIRAEVYRDHVTEVITDALLALRLNTSTLLHSRLHWRPASLGDLQDYSVARLHKYASRTQHSLNSISEAVGQELSARYSRSTASLAQDLAPLMDLVHNEMQEVGSMLQTLTRQMTRFYRRHPTLRQVSTATAHRFLALQQYVSQLSAAYQQRVQQVSEDMRTAVSAMTQYPVGQHYQQWVSDIQHTVQESIDTGVTHLADAVASLDNYLLAVRERGVYLSNTVSEAVQNVTSHPRIQYLKNTLDLSPYIQAATNKLGQLRMPEQYTAAIYKASARANEALSDVMNTPALRKVKVASNEIYQQGVWAYNYWQAEHDLQEHLHSIATLLKEIVQEELDIYTRHFSFLKKSHVTVWAPEQGEVQAELYLPVAMETLDSMPDMTPLVDQYNEVMTSLPDKDTVQYFYDNFVPQSAWWSDNNTTDNKQLMAELQDYTPSSKALRKLKKNKYRNRKTVAAM